MELFGHLFQIVDSNEQPNGFATTIRFFPDHAIFKGHFPGHPVTPGVIFLQLVQELIEHHLKGRIRLVELPNCKFLGVVNPNIQPLVLVSVSINPEFECLRVKAVGKDDSRTIFKLDVHYTVVQLTT
jgi:3-hydroxyacyl-[acyl-carrier-protein] dehydratase